MVSTEIVFIFRSACDEVKDESSLYVPVSKMDMKDSIGIARMRNYMLIQTQNLELISRYNNLPFIFKCFCDEHHT